MTDLAAPPITLEARIAELERRLGVVDPAALVPPITIGELTNVPAPGSQLAAQWAQDVSPKVIHRFANATALKAWAAPEGSFAVDLATGALWRRGGGGWTQHSPWHGRAIGIFQQPETTNPVPVASLTIPADPGVRTATATVFIRVTLFGGVVAYVNLTIDGFVVAQGVADRQVATGSQEFTLCMAGTADLPANKAVLVASQLFTTVPFAVQCFADSHRNRLDATVLPRGY